jgi:hypothetical protein
MVGLQANAERLTGAVRDGTTTVPAVVAVSVSTLPEPEAATELLIPIDVLLTPAAIVRFTTATVPLEILFAFIPETRHVYTPDPAAQFNVLLALIAAAPTVAEIDLMAAGV